MSNLWTDLKYWRERAETNERICQAFEAENHRLAERAQSFIKCLHDKERFITKLNGECTELHQRIMTQGRASAVRIDELTKRLHDKNDSVTKLEERNGILKSVLDMKTRALADFEVERAKFQEQIGMLVQDRDAMQKASCRWHEKYKDADEKLNPPTEGRNWRSEYWEMAGQSAARRDECQYLVKQNEGLKAKVKRLEEEAVVARGGCDCLTEDVEALETIVATLRELREYDQRVIRELKIDLAFK